MPQLPAGARVIEDDTSSSLPAGARPVEEPNFKTETLASESNPSLFDQLYNQVSSAKNFISDELTKHPTIRQIGQRFLTGESPEDVSAHGSLLGNTSSNSLLPEWQHPSGEGWPGYLMRGAYNQLIRPIASPAGILGAAKFSDVISSPRLPIKPEVNPAVAEDIITRKEMPGTSNTLEEIDAARDRAAQRRVDQFSRSHGIEPEKINTDIPLTSEPKENIAPVTPIAPIISPSQKLAKALEESAPKIAEQKKLYAAERAKRIAQFGETTAEGQDYINEFKKSMSGEMPKVGAMEPLANKLTPDDFNELVGEIKRAPNLDKFERGRAGLALEKLWNGIDVPQENEIDLLRKVYGDDVADMIKPVRGFKALAGKTVDFSKEMVASMDVSAPFRQGIGAINRWEYWTSIDDMFRSLGSEKFYNSMNRGIAESKHFGLGQDEGLFLSNLKSITGREERFRSSLAERIPVLGRMIRGSNRAYSGFLNKLRSDLFNNLVDSAIKAGKNPYEDRTLAQEIAGYVNTATGRGDLGSLNKYADGLNTVFFSPKFIKSRIDMLNPATYIKADPFVRKQYIKSLLGIAEFGIAATTLGKLAGGDVSLNPSSSDFLKTKFDDTRFDPLGGYQQYMVLLWRLANSEYTNSKDKTIEVGSKFGAKTYKKLLDEFASNKLSPPAKFVNDWLDQDKKRGFNYPDHVVRMFTPMLIQDIYDTMQEGNPALTGLAGAASATGIGVQSYGK